MNIIIVGAARTGQAAAKFLTGRGASLTLVDQAPESSFSRLRDEMAPLGIELRFGPHAPEIFKRADGIVISPGVPPSLPVLQKARARGVPIIAELELAFWFFEGPVVAITGTNGKTTTTTLVGEALSRWGRRVFVGGNIGNPLVNAVAANPPAELAVVEVSSFQLEGTEEFRPKVAAILNLAEDHVDRHPSMADYRNAKARIFMRQGAGDVAIVNLDDPEVVDTLPSARLMEVWGFSLDSGSDAQAVLKEHEIRLRIYGQEMRLPLRNRALFGPHGAQNLMAACLCALAVGCPLGHIESAANRFSGLEHRMEDIGQIGDVRFINDSKATNVGAVIPALNAFESPLILIAGGKDKGIDFEPLREPVRRTTRAVVLIGEAAERLGETLSKAAPVHRAGNMREAVAKAMDLAAPGDVVLLSPACSSFDQYRDYEERGEDFKRAFRLLAREGSEQIDGAG